RVDPPHPRDLLPVRFHLDQAVTRELVGLLAVLAPALPVALPRQATISGTGLAQLPESQGQVDERQDGIDALTLLLRAATGEDHRPALGQPPRRRAELGFRYTRQPLDLCGVVREHCAVHRAEAGRPPADELGVEQSLLDRDEE